MRFVFALLVFALAAAPATAQSAPAPPPCVRQDAPLAGGIGRALVVGFTGRVYGEQVCALVANLATYSFATSVAGSAGPDDVVTAALTPGTGLSLSAGDGIVVGDATPGAFPVGPYVVMPGGGFPSFGGDSSEVPRVVLAYAGQRVLLVRTTAITLIDLTHALREQSAMFGIDAAERAVLLASGEPATMQVRTTEGMLGAPVVTQSALRFVKRS